MFTQMTCICHFISLCPAQSLLCIYPVWVHSHCDIFSRSFSCRKLALNGKNFLHSRCRHRCLKGHLCLCLDIQALLLEGRYFCQYIHESVHLFVHLYVYISSHISVHPLVCWYPYIVGTSVGHSYICHMSVHPSVNLYVCWYIPTSISISKHPWVCQYINLGLKNTS